MNPQPNIAGLLSRPPRYNKGISKILHNFESECLAETKSPEGTDRPPLYTIDATGTWTCNGAYYSQAERLAWEKEERDHCAEVPHYFVTTYCRAENLHDEALGDERPMPTVELIPDWPHVRAVLDALFPPRDVVIEKSRRMIVSWIMMSACLHDLLFQKNWPIMAMSRVQTDVDDGGENSTRKSLLGKVRFLWEVLPPFLKAPLEFKHLSIVNREANTGLVGYSSSNSPGRGGGFRRAILDEFPWVEHSEQVMASVGYACVKGKVLNGTPNGKANAFYRVRQSAYRAFPHGETAKRVGQFALYSIHWSLHPHRDDTWRQQMIDSNAMTEEAVAQELDINYAKSVGRRVYPKFNEDTHVSSGTSAICACDYDPERALYLTCDFNPDPLLWEIGQVHNQAPNYRLIGEICLRNAIIWDAVADFVYRFGSAEKRALLAEKHPDHPRPLLHGLAGERGHRLPVIVTGDATEEKKTVYSHVKAYQQIKADLTTWGGFDVQVRAPASNPPREARIQTMNDAIRKNLLAVHHTCEQMRKDCEEGVWDAAGTDMNQTRMDDDHSGLTRSHASSATGYWLYQHHKVTTSARPALRNKERPSLAEMFPKFVEWNRRAP